jgi:hypothetical protein
VKFFSLIRYLSLLPLFFGGVLHAASTNLLPGIIYYDGPEKLTGKLVFLVQHDYTVETNWESAASIYEFDLRERKLHKVTASPFGQVSVSPEGNTFCVIYWLGNWGNDKATRAFIYSKPLGLTRVFNLDSPPNITRSVGDHVFFELQDGRRLLNYDISHEKISPVELPEASQWSNEGYDRIHTSSGQTNALHFSYNPRSHSGTQIRNGKEYPDGIYSFDILTENIKWLSKDYICQDDEGFTPKAFDGRFILFEGSGAPIEGFTLVSSPWEDNDIEDHSLKERRSSIKVLHKFSKLGAIMNGGTEYFLKQMSPDHHYALVRTTTSLNYRKFSEWPGSTQTYYLVDVVTGKTRILLEDRTEATTKSALWNGDLHWVGETR